MRKFSIFLIALYSILYTLYYTTPKARAETPCGSSTTNPRAAGLVTAPEISGSKFDTASGCAENIKTSFINLLEYDDLKIRYFDRSKITNKTTITDGTWPGNDFASDGIYWVTGTTNPNLDSPSQIRGNGTQVFFIDGTFAINHNITYHTADAAGGLVFIVRDNIYIKKTVTQIDAVLISFGNIYTASQNQTPCTTNSENVAEDKYLTVNGSLITLNPTPGNKIFFCRKLPVNQNPGEKINAQIKYLILLRNMLSEVIERWAEM